MKSEKELIWHIQESRMKNSLSTQVIEALLLAAEELQVISAG
jgi:hypothetical protein